MGKKIRFTLKFLHSGEIQKQNKRNEILRVDKFLTLSPDLPRWRYLKPGMTPLPNIWQSGCIVGLLPVRMSIPSMSSIASIEAIGARPLRSGVWLSKLLSTFTSCGLVLWAPTWQELLFLVMSRELGPGLSKPARSGAGYKKNWNNIKHAIAMAM